MNPVCSEREIHDLIEGFYARVREDAELGPIFGEHVQDWDLHMPKMFDFWSSLLRGSARYSGSPVMVHRRLPPLTQALFERWLTLFHASTAAQPNQALQQQADALAQRIAQSLWYDNQMHHQPDALPTGLALASAGRAGVAL